MSNGEKEAQDKPLWEQKGYESEEALYAEIMGDAAAEKARADSLEAVVSTTPTPTYPEFDKAAFDEKPEEYSAAYKKKLDTYESTVKGGPAKATAVILEATLNSELARAEEKGYDKDVVQGIIRSMVKGDPALRAKLDSPTGLKELTTKAMEKLKAHTPSPPTNEGNGEEDDEDKPMVDGVPPEHKDKPGRSSVGARQSTPKQSEVERLDSEIKTHIKDKRGVGADLVQLTIERNLAQLGIAKPKG